MDKQSIWTWFKSLPIWLRVVIGFLFAALAVFSSLGLSSCGTTRAVVTNRAEQTTTTIKISTNNPTSVETSPDVSLELIPNGNYKSE